MALLDLSNNQLTGSLLLTGFEDSNTILNTTGNMFVCPMPHVLAGQLALFSPCVPNYRQIYYYLEILGCVIAVVACFGLFFYCAKWHGLQKLSNPQWKAFVIVRGWASFLAWAFAGFSLYSDLELLWGMQRYVLSEATNCHHVNERGVFLSFMPSSDIFGGFNTEYSASCASLVRYYGTAGPYGPIDSKIPVNVSTCFLGLSFSLTPPPPTQMYASYSQVLQEWDNAGFFLDRFADNAAFSKLCQRFAPFCHVVTVDGIPVCSNTRDESRWSSKTHYSFFIVVLLTLTYKVVLEACKLGVIFFSIWRLKLWQPNWTLGFIQNSLGLFLLKFAGIDPWRDVLLAQLNTIDWVCLFVYDGFLYRAPILGLTVWYIKKVTQQGLTLLNYFSLFSGMLSVLYILARGLYTIKRSRVSVEVGSAIDTEISASSLKLHEIQSEHGMYSTSLLAPAVPHHEIPYDTCDDSSASTNILRYN